MLTPSSLAVPPTRIVIAKVTIRQKLKLACMRKGTSR